MVQSDAGDVGIVGCPVVVSSNVIKSNPTVYEVFARAAEYDFIHFDGRRVIDAECVDMVQGETEVFKKSGESAGSRGITGVDAGRI